MRRSSSRRDRPTRPHAVRPQVEPLEGRSLLATVTEFPIPPVIPPHRLDEIAAGPDGAVWFTASDSLIGRIAPDGTITEFAIPRHPSPPTDTYSDEEIVLGDIAAGPGGDAWFVEYRVVHHEGFFL